MATLADSSEEVVIVRMGDLYFFPCALPQGSELQDVGPGMKIYPCIGQPFFAIGADVSYMLHYTQENQAEYRIRIAVGQVWNYLLGKGVVIGVLPEIVDGSPNFNPVSVS